MAERNKGKELNCIDIFTDIYAATIDLDRVQAIAFEKIDTEAKKLIKTIS